MKYTTTRLELRLRDRWRIHEATIRNAAWGGVFVVSLLLIHSLLAPAQAQPAPAVRVEVQRAILVATATAMPPAPTATPWPTPEPVVIEVPAPPAEPVYVYVPVEMPPTMPAQPVMDATHNDDAPPPPPDAPQDAQGVGGSGKMPAIDVGPIPSVSGDDAARWCAAAASAGVAHCTGQP